MEVLRSAACLSHRLRLRLGRALLLHCYYYCLYTSSSLLVCAAAALVASCCRCCRLSYPPTRYRLFTTTTRETFTLCSRDAAHSPWSACTSPLPTPPHHHHHQYHRRRLSLSHCPVWLLERRPTTPHSPPSHPTSKHLLAIVTPHPLLEHAAKHHRQNQASPSPCRSRGTLAHRHGPKRLPAATQACSTAHSHQLWQRGSPQPPGRLTA